MTTGRRLAIGSRPGRGELSCLAEALELNSEMAANELLIQLIDELARLNGRLISIKTGFMEEGDPTGLANLVLTAVVRASVPPTVPQIGRSLGHQRQTVQRKADLLAEEGLVDWIDNPDHKSSKRLVPTDRGRSIYEAASGRSHQWATRFVETIDHDSLAIAVATLRAIRAQIESEARERN